MFDIAIMCGKIRLGKQGENHARRVPFELGLWENQFGEGRCELLHQRNGDEAPYPVKLIVENNVAYWYVSSVDTAVAGRGECELRYIVNDVVVKSCTYVTKVSESLGKETEEVPEAAKPWVDEVLDAAEDVKNATTHQPIIGENGNWFTWDAETESYIDTGTSASSGGGGNYDVAKVEKGTISLVGITTSSDTVTSTITENQLSTRRQDVSFYIDFQGRADIEISSTDAVNLYVDGEMVVRLMKKISWSGVVSENLRVVRSRVENETATITFNKFIGTVYTDGLMTGEDKEKLDNTYTKEESDSRFAENKVASATTKETTLEQLYNEGKANGLGTVNGNKWTSIGADTFTINVQGKVSFSDVTKSEYMKIYIDGKEFEGTDFNGAVESKIVLKHVDLSVGSVEFASFSVTEYTGGLMSGEDKQKLDNTPTTEEVNNLITEAFGTVEAVFDEVHEYAESLGGDEA